MHSIPPTFAGKTHEQAILTGLDVWGDELAA